MRNYNDDTMIIPIYESARKRYHFDMQVAATLQMKFTAVNTSVLPIANSILLFGSLT